MRVAELNIEHSTLNAERRMNKNKVHLTPALSPLQGNAERG